MFFISLLQVFTKNFESRDYFPFSHGLLKILLLTSGLFSNACETIITKMLLQNNRMDSKFLVNTCSNDIKNI